MPTKFVSIDCETANADLSSICQVGIVLFEDGLVSSTWQTLINPEDEFDVINLSIHGIDESSVEDAPKFPDVFQQIEKRLRGEIVVCHTFFDRSAIDCACLKYNLPKVECRWLDSARVVRRAWPEFAEAGYALWKITRHLGIKFTHHVAAEDARAAGEIVLRAISHTGLDLGQWLVRVKRPTIIKDSIARDGNPEGPLAGEEVAFTGALSITRREAAILAAKIGCNVAETIRKSTTILVVGNQDIRYLAGHSKSSKHRKAEQLIKKGQPIRILTENDFNHLLSIEE